MESTASYPVLLASIQQGVCWWIDGCGTDGMLAGAEGMEGRKRTCFSFFHEVPGGTCEQDKGIVKFTTV